MRAKTMHNNVVPYIDIYNIYIYIKLYIYKVIQV